MAGLVPAIDVSGARGSLARTPLQRSSPGIPTMMPRSTDTIFAAASGFGRAAVTVVRISGPGTRAVLEAVAGGVPAQARRMSLRTLRDPRTAEALDQALVVWMPGPGSFTGEDQAELQIHGGLAVRSAVLAALAGLEGCRPAEAGEFTRRAFLNGRMDLSRIEGLADLIDAETEAQRRQALHQLEGRLGHAVEAWREAALQILALLEAALDFADEGDVPETLEREASARITGLHGAIAEMLSRPGGERLREVSWSFSRVRPTPASRRSSTPWRSGTSRSCRRCRGRPGMRSRCGATSVACPWCSSIRPACATARIRSSRKASPGRGRGLRRPISCCGLWHPARQPPHRTAPARSACS
jgi:hypothetical protein